MSDDLQLEEVTTKPWFYNANSKFYYKLGNSQTAKMKRIHTCMIHVGTM